MDHNKPRILIVDDEEDILLLYKNIFKSNYNISLINNGSDAVKKANEEHFDLAIVDILMPGMNGIEVLRKLKELDSSIEVIMVTASREIRPAVDSLKCGAFDYLVKPFDVDNLVSLVTKAIERRSILMENLYLKQALDERVAMGELIGKSIKIKHVYDIIENIAPSDSTVLITGESGTGKEIVAETIHKKSKRKNMPYVIVNCAAIPDNLLESEMFGHERGSFTGAVERHVGKFELANGGTIFLDEIGEMRLPMQAKLLRAVQEGMIERIGSEKNIPVDVRIIAATNIDIRKAIKEKAFREDLFYRLNVIPINMPPLRERIEDLPIFVNYFIEQYNKELNKSIKYMSGEALKILKNYPWPGNVRELENLIERIIAISKDSYIDIQHIPSELVEYQQKDKEEFRLEEDSLIKAVKTYEKKLLMEALKASGGNQTNAAKKLGIHRTTLISKLDSMGLKD